MESWTSAWLCKDKSVDSLSTTNGLDIFSCPSSKSTKRKQKKQKKEREREKKLNKQKRSPLLGNISFWQPQSFLVQEPPNCNFTGFLTVCSFNIFIQEENGQTSAVFVLEDSESTRQMWDYK